MIYKTRKTEQTTVKLDKEQLSQVSDKELVNQLLNMTFYQCSQLSDGDKQILISKLIWRLKKYV